MQPTQEKITTTVQQQQVQVAPPQGGYKKKKAIFRAYQLIWYLLGVIETLLLFRVILLMLGANTRSGFTDLIYSLTDPLAAPFAGIFGVTRAEGSVFEWSTIVAGIVYFLVAYGLVQLIQLVKPTTPQEVEQTVNNQ